MSYNLIIIALIILIPINCLLVFFSYRQGLKDGRQVKDDKPIKPIIEPIATFKKYEQNKEMKRLNTILENINNYSGSGVGQKEVRD